MPKNLRITATLVFGAFGPLPFLAPGEPISFPTDENPPRYVEDFEDVLGVEWTIDSWLQDFIPLSGAPEMSGNGNGGGLIRLSDPSALDDSNFGGANFPLAPLVPSASYTDFGFDGSWLVTQPLGPAVEDPPDSGTFAQLSTGSALLEFKDLPEHQSIDVFVKLAVFDSIDGGNNENRDGPFEILIDGNGVLNHMFNASGSNFSGTEGVRTLAVSQNLTGNYREEWNENDGTGPADDADRFTHGWTLDSGFELGAVPTMIAVPHTADTISIEFIHRIGGSTNDEGIAIEDVRVVLNEDLTSSIFNWPANRISVADDFSAGGLPNWEFEVVDNGAGATTAAGGWSVVPVPAGGVAEIASTGTGNAQIRPSSGGLDDQAFGGADFPVAPLIAGSDYGTLTGGAISGNWLQQIGVGPATESVAGSGTFDVTNDGIARLTFVNLPAHTGVDLDLLVAAGGSWDGGTASPNHDEAFEIRIDGTPLWSHFFGNGGATLDGSPGVSTLFTTANVNDHYLEEWNDNGGAGPAGENDRFLINWTMDSAYDLGGLAELTEIPHTSDTLTIEFIHRLNSNFNDEQVALENLTVSLIGVPTQDIEIVNIDQFAGEVFLEWTSELGLNYIIERSFDLVTWEQIGDPIVGELSTTEGFDNSLPPDTEEAFYRIGRL